MYIFCTKNNNCIKTALTTFVYFVNWNFFFCCYGVGLIMVWLVVDSDNYQRRVNSLCCGCYEEETNWKKPLQQIIIDLVWPICTCYACTVRISHVWLWVWDILIFKFNVDTSQDDSSGTICPSASDDVAS